MASEDPYRHPGGRSCAGAMLMIMSALTAVSGFTAGIVWAVLR
jgi:hypothetical protein